MTANNSSRIEQQFHCYALKTREQIAMGRSTPSTIYDKIPPLAISEAFVSKM